MSGIIADLPNDTTADLMYAHLLNSGISTSKIERIISSDDRTLVDLVVINSDQSTVDGIVAAYDAVTAQTKLDEITTSELETIKQSKYNDIDRYAETTRLSFVTSGAGQAMVYQEKGEEAADYIAAGYPVDLTSYPFIQAEVNATGKTSTQAADDIISQKSAWIAIGAAIEEIRLTGKKAVVDAGSDQNGMDIAVATVISSLEAL